MITNIFFLLKNTINLITIGLIILNYNVTEINDYVYYLALTHVATKDWSVDNPSIVLEPNWITGFTDSEGNFSCRLEKGNKVSLIYKVDKKEDSAGILYSIQRFYFLCVDMSIQIEEDTSIIKYKT